MGEAEDLGELPQGSRPQPRAGFLQPRPLPLAPLNRHKYKTASSLNPAAPGRRESIRAVRSLSLRGRPRGWWRTAGSWDPFQRRGCFCSPRGRVAGLVAPEGPSPALQWGPQLTSPGGWGTGWESLETAEGSSRLQARLCASLLPGSEGDLSSSSTPRLPSCIHEVGNRAAWCPRLLRRCDGSCDRPPHHRCSRTLHTCLLRRFAVPGGRCSLHRSESPS